MKSERHGGTLRIAPRCAHLSRDLASTRKEECTMPIAERTAEVIWDGSLAGGHGHSESGSGALTGLPVTWAARTETPEGRRAPRNWLPLRTRRASPWRSRSCSAKRTHRLAHSNQRQLCSRRSRRRPTDHQCRASRPCAGRSARRGRIQWRGWSSRRALSRLERAPRQRRDLGRGGLRPPPLEGR